MLVGLDPEAELDQHLQSLKQQVQVIPDPGRKSNEELARERWGPGQIKQKDRVGEDFGSGYVGSSGSKAESQKGKADQGKGWRIRQNGSKNSKKWVMEAMEVEQPPSQL